jgi:hypothetical protein
VGETTGGGAPPVSSQRIDEHFTISVPFARAINPVTTVSSPSTCHRRFAAQSRSRGQRYMGSCGLMRFVSDSCFRVT